MVTAIAIPMQRIDLKMLYSRSGSDYHGQLSLLRDAESKINLF